MEKIKIKNMQSEKIKSWIFLTLAMSFWGMSFIWTGILLKHLTPVSIITLRLVLSSLFLLVFSLIFRKFEAIKKQDLKYFILLAFFQPFIYFIFEGYGIKNTSASFAAIIISTIPLFTPLGVRLFYKNQLSVLNFVGLIISFVGVALIVLNKSVQIKISITGILLLFGAVFSGVAYFLTLKKIVDNYNSVSIATWQNIIGIIYFIPLFFYLGFDDITKVSFTGQVLNSLLALSILASSLAFIFNTYSVRVLGPSKTAAFTNSVPVFTVIFAYYFLNEPVSFHKIAGMTIVITGLMLSQYSKKKEKNN